MNASLVLILDTEIPFFDLRLCEDSPRSFQQ